MTPLHQQLELLQDILGTLALVFTLGCIGAASVLLIIHIARLVFSRDDS